MKVSGQNADALFAPEQGGHRWQRIPETEKRGRKQSSTVTVAVLGSSAPLPEFKEADVEYRYCVASVGAGGQNRQKNATACVARHAPTGIEAKCEDERSQKANRRKALQELRKRVTEEHRSQEHSNRNASRVAQMGSGERGDKIRTVQVHHGVVSNHVTGKKLNLDKYLKGFVEDIQ